MSTVWFTSDLHFGHEKVALSRGFDSVEEHDEAMVKMYNLLVTKHDSVYILGDICISRVGLPHLGRLRGFKTVVLGNHDQKNHSFIYPDYADRVEGVITKSILGHHTIMTHIPIHPSEFYRWRLNIHGHLHGGRVPLGGGGFRARFVDPRYFNVCPEQNQLYPFSIDEIKDYLKAEMDEEE